MDRRLHAVQDRLVEHCTQTLKSVQGSMSVVTSVSLTAHTIERRTKESNVCSIISLLVNH